MDKIDVYRSYRTERFGRIEDISGKDFLSGQLIRTYFHMRLLSEKDHLLTNEVGCYCFFGDIPKEFVGKEARYTEKTSIYENSQEVTLARIEVGKIVKKDEGICKIIEDKQRNPTIPKMIQSWSQLSPNSK